MISNTSRLRVLSLVALLASGVRLHAQSASVVIDPAIASLARRIGEPLQKEKIKKVFVADLRGPEGQEHPVGKWLADQLSDSLERDFPGLEVIDRSKKDGIVSGGENPLDMKKEKGLARKLGAKVVIGGSFAKVGQGIGISLSAEFSSGSRRLLAETNGLVPFSDEIASVSPDPIPSPKGGIAKAGVGGATLPSCIQCPPPEYTRKAMAARYEGSVALVIVVTLEGQAQNITVVKDPGLGLAEKAIEAVRRWKFKPAVGPDGNPVATIVPIEVTFRLSWYR